MYIKVNSAVLEGLTTHCIEVEVDIQNGLPNFLIVGLPDTMVKESKDRVSAAVKNCGLDFPVKKITVNLAPAFLKKDGSGIDLAIAAGILAVTGQISAPGNIFLFGELSLDGAIRPVRGILPMLIELYKKGCSGVIVPYANRNEAGLVKGLDVYPAENLIQVVSFLNGNLSIPAYHTPESISIDDTSDEADFTDVKGQEAVKRSLTVAAAGYHNIIMIGSPGSGKTMLARRLCGIMPQMDFDQILSTTQLYSVSGMLSENRFLISERVFRSPHSSISPPGLIGGSSIPRPGEVSLAHNGILFLDELPEYRRTTLELLRQPLSDGEVTISRAHSSVTYPADFLLIAACNPCPCGYYFDSVRKCTCSENRIKNYMGKLSGPLLDRIDLQIEVRRLTPVELISAPRGESTSEIRKKVQSAWLIQKERFSRTKIRHNSRMNRGMLEKHCQLDSETAGMLRGCSESMGLSARAYDKILRISRTIADLEQSENIRLEHVAEAVQYRFFDRKTWF